MTGKYEAEWRDSKSYIGPKTDAYDGKISADYMENSDPVPSGGAFPRFHCNVCYIYVHQSSIEAHLNYHRRYEETDG